MLNPDQIKMIEAVNQAHFYSSPDSVTDGIHSTYAQAVAETLDVLMKGEEVKVDSKLDKILQGSPPMESAANPFYSYTEAFLAGALVASLTYIELIESRETPS